MHLNLRPKIMIGFTMILIFTGMLFLMGELYGARYARNSIGNAMAMLAEERARKIDTVLSLAQEAVINHSKHKVLRTFLEDSNAEFAAMGDRRTYISSIDREWIRAAPGGRIPMMETVAGNEIAQTLREEFVDFSFERYGYRKYAEIILTNRYGALVVMTGIASDYFQGDELWWIRAWEDGLWTGGPEYDESSGVHAIAFGVRINNDAGEPIGVFKAVVDIKGIIRENLVLARRFQSTRFKILTPEGRMIYATTAFRYDEDVSDEDYFLGLKGESGYFQGVEGGRDTVYAYARSPGDRRTRGPGWIIIVGHDKNEIMAPARTYQYRFRLAAALFILFGITISFLVSDSIAKPVEELKKGAEAIGRGRLDHRVAVRSRDEIGRLAESFNAMAGRLARAEKELTEEREGLEATVRERTEGIARVNEELSREADSRKKVEQALVESNERLTRFMNAATDAYYIFDSGMKLLELNREGERVLGKPKNELVGREMAELRPDAERRGRIERYRRVMKSGKPAKYEDVIVTVAGKDRHFNFNAFPVGEGMGLIASDVTKIKDYEEDLRSNIEELERSNRDLEQFAYVASHDLQEPLRIITSYVRMLEEYFEGRLDARAAEYFGFIVESTHRMRNLILDLLAYSRVDTRGKKAEVVDSGEAVAKALGNLKVAIDESGAEVTWKALPPVMADRVQTVQVFQNVIGNAIKFRREDPPRVRVNAKLDDKNVLFEVSDNGLGIAEEFYDRIFVIFQRLHARDEYGGTGIGLALVKKIVERHGGKVWVESVVGKGTKVFFTLPYAGEERESA